MHGHRRTEPIDEDRTKTAPFRVTAPLDMTKRLAAFAAPDDPDKPEAPAGSAPQPPRPPLLKRRRLWVLAAAGIPIAAYLVAGAMVTGEIRQGTRVAGVEVGGLSPAAAGVKLTTGLRDRGRRPISIELAGKTQGKGERSYELDPEDAGLALDTRATVTGLDSGFPMPWELIPSTVDVPPTLRVDERRLKASVERIAADVDVQLRDASVRYKGLRPVPVTPKKGKALDQPAARMAARQAFLLSSRVTFELKTIQPTVSRKRAGDVARKAAKTAVSGPLTLTLNAKKADLPRPVIAANLEWVPDGEGGLMPRFDAARAVAGGVERKLIDPEDAARDAGFKIVNGRPKVIRSKKGQIINKEALAKTAAKVFLGGASRTIPVETRMGEPWLTTKRAKQFGVKEKVSSFTTRHPCCAPRVTNIHRMADIIDGHVVKPGETFSLNGVVGARDRARGFVPAPMILNGRFVDSVGGGVSQFATTMFNAVFFGGFQDVQHMPHVFYISRYPPGRESTVSFPQPDFRWRNDSQYGVLIKTSYTSTSITVDFWSTKRFDVKAEDSGSYNVRDFPSETDSGPDCQPMPGAEGFTIDVWRIFRKDGETVRREKFHTVYQPEPKLTCEKEKDADSEISAGG